MDNRLLITLVVVFIMATATCLSACHAGNHGLLGKRRPIKKETTAIHYSIHTNSGIAVQTDYDITPDSITWLYRDRRNGFTLRDVVKYDPKDYDALIDTLSQVAFKVRHVKSTASRGGGGYAYSFFDSKGKYLGYGVSNYIASGDNETAEEAISQFLYTHRTAGEQAVKDAKEKGKLNINMEEFPETLVPYRLQ